MAETPAEAKADLKRIMEMAIAEAVDHFWPYTRVLRVSVDAAKANREKMN